MMKIMIVDDMPIFLEYLRGCIDWKSYGFELCCEAHDGKEALDKLEKYDPDVVLTDITMPYLNGLELSEQITKQYPSISIILITGNNEFEYARRAVKIGVCDYIVKPFEKEELILSLLKLQDNVNRAIELKNQREEDTTKKKEEVLRGLMAWHQSEETEEILAALEEAGIHFASPYYLVCTMQLKSESLSDVERIMNWEIILMNLLEGMLSLEGTYEVFKDYENHIVVILNFKQEEDMKSYKIYELSDLMKIIKSQLKLNSVISVSDYCYGVSAVRDGYYQTLQALGAKENEGRGSILDCKKIQVGTVQSFYSMDAIEQLTRGIELLNEEMVEKTIRQEWERIHAFHDDMDDMNLITSLLSVLLSVIVQSGRNVTDIFGKEFFPYESIQSLPRSEKEQAVIQYYLGWVAYQKKNKNTKSHVIVEKVKDYISSNYENPEMNIGDIAKELYMNQTYLRKVFKSEMNMTILEYITKYRMHMAKKMILETDQLLSDIGEQVGYSDVSYFSKCFKKYYGVSPKNIKAE